MARWYSYLKVIEHRARSGEIAFKLGVWAMENNQWGAAVVWMERSLAKGDLSDPCAAREFLARAYQLLGCCSRQEA